MRENRMHGSMRRREATPDQSAMPRGPRTPPADPTERPPGLASAAPAGLLLWVGGRPKLHCRCRGRVGDEPAVSPATRRRLLAALEQQCQIVRFPRSRPLQIARRGRLPPVTRGYGFRGNWRGRAGSRICGRSLRTRGRVRTRSDSGVSRSQRPPRPGRRREPGARDRRLRQRQPPIVSRASGRPLRPV